VRQRWLSRRALTLHLGTLLFVPLCFLAGWWQVSRATGGNDLSYVYAVEWPAFAIAAVYLWWSLLHTDPETVGARAQRRAARATAGTADGVEGMPERRRDEEDEELAAYNDRLAELAQQGPKTWRRP
jgi:hypothetical protein